MIIVDCEQGTEAWWQARLGIPTASEFDKILTPAKLEPSKSAEGYMNKLIAEWYRGKPDETFQSEFMKRGNEFEEEARQWYGFTHDCEPQKVGFCKDHDDRWGCSPDALIGDDGGIEIKSVISGTMVGYVMENRIPLEYKLQVIGSILVTGREWWEFLVYHPDFKPLLIRTERKDVQKELDALQAALDTFCKKLAVKREEFRLRMAA
jgi:hypothetical protein